MINSFLSLSTFSLSLYVSSVAIVEAEVGTEVARKARETQNDIIQSAVGRPIHA